ncbi:VOC family protein [Streptomyces sp. NPDC091292]|uniref:VOC family protein n=1 Tax=Streptomyces sp. NPDC091292 TaxID=3365991 RepID=UPI0037FE0ED0
MTPDTPAVPPSKLSHVVLQTNQFPALRDWYCTVLAAHPVFDNGALAFLAYDDEHHRIGLMSLDRYEERAKTTVGLQHFSFTYDTLPDLFATYERLKKAEIQPIWCVNHGPTVSLYYADPDGNQVELQFDVFETAAEVTDFMNGPIYQSNPVGTPFDPEDMAARLRSGTSVAELTRRTA